MNHIIFNHERLRKPLMLVFRPRIVGLLLLPLLVLPLLGAGVVLVWEHYRGHSAVVLPATFNAASVHADASDQLKAISARMVELQVRMVRLDALGQHLAETNNLKSREFDFSKKPMGGPLLPSLSVISSATELSARLDALSQEIENRENQLAVMDSILRGRQSSSPQLVLGNSPLRSTEQTSGFGYRVDPFNGHISFHPGIDFAGTEGQGIFATGSGVVTWAGPRTGYGNMVEINHGGGLFTHYGHCSALVVHTGDVVSGGQLIAYIGSTGRSTGPHLHYEVVVNGSPVNPATYLALNGK